MSTREAFNADTGETVTLYTTPKGKTYQSCYGCGGAGCYTCDGSGWLQT